MVYNIDIVTENVTLQILYIFYLQASENCECETKIRHSFVYFIVQLV